MNRFLYRKNILLVLFLFSRLFVIAADPTTSASNVQFPLSSIDGAQFNVTFTAGNGTGGRIVVVKEGSEVTGVPVDGTKYNFNSLFGTAGTEFTAAGEFVVAQTTSSSPVITVTNLKPGTTYYVAIFELNGTYSTASTIDYSTVTPTGKSVTTVSAPTSAAAITGFTQAGGGSSQVSGNAVRINWTNGNGTGRIVVVRKGNAFTAKPVDLTSYNWSASFKSTATGSYYLDAESFIVFKGLNAVPGKAEYADINNLEPNTTYTFAIFELNGNYSPVYLKTIISQSVTTNAGPTKQASNLTFTAPDGNKLNFYWANGNGTKRIVVAKKGSAVTTAPVNGNSYIANAQFGSGTEMVAGSQEYVVYNGNSNSVTVTNLEKFTTYHFAVYEYDADGNGFTYYLASLAPGRGNSSTALVPTGQTTITATNITGSSAQLTYHYPASGAGAYRMLVIKDGGAVDFVPEDLKLYSAFTDTYGVGTPVATNTYILFGQANGGAPTVKGLQTGHTYYVTVFEMNGATAPVYKVPGASVEIVVPNEPTTGAKNPIFPTVDGNLLRFDWTNGDGSRRIVIAKKGSAVVSVPQDGTTYTASANFGNASSEITPGSGEYVVFDGTGNSISVLGLEKATTYHFAVFEYNLSGSSPDYLTTSAKWLAASKSTSAAPTVQTTNISAFNIQSTQANINFTTGNGAAKLFVMREGASVDAEPTDFMVYNNGSNMYGQPAQQLGSGNYIVGYGIQGSFTVSGLKAGTQYYVTAFEYNGSLAPVYLRPGATMYNFTTTGGVVAPSQVSTNPVFSNIDGNKFNFQWTNGNGANRVVVARKGSAVNFVPADGTAYPADASFGSNADLGGGQYVVLNGAGSNVSLTNLEPNATYHFAVYEYNGTAGTIKYSGSALNANNATAASPTIKSSTPTNTTGAGSITLIWISGNGQGRIVVAKEGSEVTAAPAVLNKYTANSVFKNGPQLAAGEYIVYAGTGNTVTVTGLENNKTYHFSVFEYNGTDAPVYNTTDVLKTSAQLFSALPVTWLYAAAQLKNDAVLVEWATAQEVNSDYFEVQESIDGSRFSVIATIKAAGNTGVVQRYSFIDATANSTGFYRIKQVDRDGKFSYSKVLAVSGAGISSIQLLQNPVHDYLRLNIPKENMGADLIVTDATGRVFNKQKITSALTVVPTSQLANGIYYVLVQDHKGNAAATFPFVRQ